MKQKLVIAHMPVNEKDRLATVLFENDKAVEFYLSDPDEDTLINNIYVGHVSRVVPQSGGAFVRFGEGLEGFLPAGKSRNAVYKSRKKTDELKGEDELLVLVETEALKTKLPGLSAEIRITGKYLVISSGFSGFNFSKKLSKEEKLFLSENLAKLDTDYGFIVRTQAGTADMKAVLEEARSLTRKLSDIITYGVARPAGTCLLKTGGIWLEKLKQLRSEELEQIITDDEAVYESVLQSECLADCDRSKVKLYRDNMVSLYRLNSMAAVLDSATQKKVWLKSGGSIIIEQTEAFVCIDVNSSKTNKKDHNDELFLKLNLEAAQEIARQIRMRQLSGTILIDFINMKEQTSDEKLLEEVRILMKRDSADVNVIDITKLGIMEITRKKKGRSLLEQVNG